MTILRVIKGMKLLNVLKKLRKNNVFVLLLWVVIDLS